MEKPPADRWEMPCDRELLELEVDKMLERSDARVFEVMEKFREMVIDTDSKIS